MAVGLFTVGFGYVVHVSVEESGQVSNVSSDLLEADAERLAETVLGSSGVGWYVNPVCTGGQADPDYLQADSVERLGLAPESCATSSPSRSINLSFEKLENLGNGEMTADPANGYLDYPEARESLGLGDTLKDFHLRSWPALPDVAEILDGGTRDPLERVAYIGAYQTLGGTPGAYIVQKACGVTDGATSADAWVDITNNGTTPAAFEVSFEIPLDDRTIEVVEHTGVLLPTLTQRVSATLTKSADWEWAASPEVDVYVSDHLRYLGSCTSDFTGITMTAASTKKQVFVHTEKLENLLEAGSITPKIYYDAYEGDGDTASYSDWKLEVKNGLGLVVGSDVNLHSRGWETLTLVGADTYTVAVQTMAGALLGEDTINALASPLTGFTPGLPSTGYDPKDPVVPEAAYVAALVEDFTPNVFSADYASAELAYVAGGDVFPDVKTVLNNELVEFLMDDMGTPSPDDDVPTLANYNILVVGSDVDHNAMTSAAAKQTIRDWVYGGGFLMVFGSYQQAVQWLQPIFHSALDSASGPLLAPDTAHPVLHTPNELEYASYDAGDNIWDFTREEDSQHFAHVVTQGSGDVLAVSDSGEFGDGRVLLTSYVPYDLEGGGATGPCDPAAVQASCPALQLFHNFLTFGYRDLYLDYGPPLPGGSPIGVAQRLATVYHPTLGQSVEVIIHVYLF